jgi:hypothetical protein
VWATRGSNTRSSQAELKFFVDAPAGGLAPGKYTASISLLEAGRTPQTSVLISAGDTLTLKIKPYSCHIDVQPTVTLTSNEPNTEIPIKVNCAAPASNPANVTANVSFYASAAGFSASQFNPSVPQRLPVQDSNMFIVANWGRSGSVMVPTCTGVGSQTLLFDGTTAVEDLTTSLPPNYVVGWARYIKFRLCPDNLANETAGQYTARAIFSIVTK